MAHFIEPIVDASIDATIAQLESAHTFVGKQLRRAHMRHFCLGKSNFGVIAKRIKVSLLGKRKPEIIGKLEENYVEVINMAATLERLISGLKWIRYKHKSENLIVSYCHPSTSSDKNTNSNDLVIVDGQGKEKIRCEVSDVVSKNLSQNKKEAKDIRSLGCENIVPNDGVRRFLCVSQEFAEGLVKTNRDWSSLHYRYQANDTGDSTGTVMIEILSKSNAT